MELDTGIDHGITLIITPDQQHGGLAYTTIPGLDGVSALVSAMVG